MHGRHSAASDDPRQYGQIELSLHLQLSVPLWAGESNWELKKEIVITEEAHGRPVSRWHIGESVRRPFAS